MFPVFVVVEADESVCWGVGVIVTSEVGVTGEVEEKGKCVANEV